MAKQKNVVTGSKIVRNLNLPAGWGQKKAYVPPPPKIIEVKAIDRFESADSGQPPALAGAGAEEQTPPVETAAVELMANLRAQIAELHRQVNDWRATAEELVEARRQEGATYNLVLADLEASFMLSIKKLAILCLGLKDPEARLLRAVASGSVDDDANLDTKDKKAARRLYKLGLLAAAPVEGSDAPVDALAITEVGVLVLKSLDIGGTDGRKAQD